LKPVIVVKDLVKRYGSLTAVNGISFEVYENEIFGIIGPNGAGKTSAVECIVGIRNPSSGTVKVLGLDPTKNSSELRELIGIQLQEGSLPHNMKVREALQLFAKLYQRTQPVEPLLAQMGIAQKANDWYEKLSGGQKQRLAIALALVNDPKVVVFDELTTGLDPQARRAMWEMVRKIHALGKTVLLVTHFMEEAEKLCDRVALIDEGNIVALDTPANLIQSINSTAPIPTLEDVFLSMTGKEMRE